MKIFLFPERDRMNTALYFYDEVGEKINVFNFNTQEAKVISRFEKVPENYILSLPNDALVDLTKALVEHLDKKGIRSDTEQKLSGKLIAQSYHLEDLRKLLKLA